MADYDMTGVNITNLALLNGAAVGGGIGSFVDTSIAISSDGTALAADDGTNNQNIGIGRAAGQRLTIGTSNTCVGDGTLQFATTSTFNTCIGSGAGLVGSMSSGYNTLLGATSGQSVAGANNTGAGYQTLMYVTTGTHNTALGSDALKGNSVSKLTGSHNSGIGYQTGYSLTTGSYNVLSGYQAGYSLTTATDQILIGQKAGLSIVAGTGSVCIGLSAGEFQQNLTGSVYIGEKAGRGTTGVSNYTNHNVCVGLSSGEGLTAGDFNTYLGAHSGDSNTSGEYNVSIGYYAGANETTASNKLHIANNSTESLIEGDFAAKTLRANGTFSSTGKTYTTKTAAYTAIAGDLIMADTATTAAFTITLPTSPTSGDVIKIHDVKGNFATANLTVARGVTSQEPINGTAEDFVCDVAYQNVELLFTNATDGWRIL